MTDSVIEKPKTKEHPIEGLTQNQTSQLMQIVRIIIKLERLEYVAANTFESPQDQLLDNKTRITNLRKKAMEFLNKNQGLKNKI